MGSEFSIPQNRQRSMVPKRLKTPLAGMNPEGDGIDTKTMPLPIKEAIDEGIPMGKHHRAQRHTETTDHDGPKLPVAKMATEDNVTRPVVRSHGANHLVTAFHDDRRLMRTMGIQELDEVTGKVPEDFSDKRGILRDRLLERPCEVRADRDPILARVAPLDIGQAFS